MKGLLSHLRGLIRRQRSRQHLIGLSDAALKDIGITRRQAESEARKAFWQ